MNRRCMIAVFAPALISVAILAAPVGASEETWIAPSRRAQLSMDPTMLPKGKGLLFVPAMTSGFREPEFLVLRDDRVVEIAETGVGILLSPGTYELKVGSGTLDQMTGRTVEIVEDMTTLVDPWWAGLVIDVIDETRTSINERYEIYEDTTRENMGIGFGVEEECGQAVSTWLLRPGLYTILKVGDNAATNRRFSVRLLPGTLEQRRLVVDGNGDFIGFYPPSFLHQGLLADSNWRSNWELSMSALFNTTQNSAGEDQSTISFSGQLRNRTRYNRGRHFADFRFIVEEGFGKERGDPLKMTVDEAEVRSTYIYRISRFLSPYLRGVATTKFFATDVFFDTSQDLVLTDADGNTVETLRDIDDFELEPPFYPIQLRQGIGINSQLYRSFALKADLRLGFGARQTLVKDVYELSDDRTSARRLEDATSTGVEGLVIVDARLGRQVSLDSEFDILMPAARTETWAFTFENRLRTSLTPTIKMDVVFNFDKLQPLLRVESRQQVLLTFVQFF